MPGQVAVVTDSTASLPGDLAAQLGITVVPLLVQWGGQSRLEGVEVSGTEVAAALRAGHRVTTSRPAPAQFIAAYEHIAASGADRIVSVHLSGRLSGTVEAAEIAAAEMATRGVHVTVVDSGTIGMALGYGVIAAAELASQHAAGGSNVAQAARDVMARSRAAFYVDTLEHLRAGGRIGAVQSVVGTALAVKPLLTIRSGEIAVAEKVRTRKRALERLVQRAATLAEGISGGAVQGVDIAVHHLADAPAAQRVREALEAALGTQVRRSELSEVGSVIGAHVGPGLVAVVAAPVPATT